MEITEIKSRLNIGTVLNYYGLQPDKNKRLHCPFHNDKTPSMQVYPKTNTVYCFSSNCKTHGKAIDVIDFIMYKENCTKHQAIKKAKELLNHVEIKPAMKVSTKVELEQVNTEILSKIFNYFLNGFMSRKINKGRIYLQSRNLDVSKLENLGISFGYNSAQFHHRGRISPEDMQACEQSGLLIKSNNSSKSDFSYTPWASYCVIFPLTDEKGNITGMYGRSTANNPHNKHFYLRNSKGLFYYPGSDTKKLIITESIIDFLSLYQIDEIRNNYDFLPIYGTNRLNGEHIKATSKLQHLQEIIFFLDGDKAGKEAVSKYSKDISRYVSLPQEIIISNIETPKDEDINSLLLGHSPEVFTHLIENRKFLFSNEKTSIEKKSDPQTNNHQKTNNFQAVESDKVSVKPFHKLNINNQEYITFETKELKINIWGGIDMQQVRRLRATLHLRMKNNPVNDFRDTIDLYSNNQTDRFIKQSSEKLEVSTTLISQTITILTNELEQYRQKEREKKRAKEETRRKSETDSFSKEQLNKAQKLLETKGLTQKTFDLTGQIGLIGHQKNGMLLFMIYLTRMFKNPLHAIVMGGSAAGKTHLLQTIASLVPKQQIKSSTSLSENTLYYSGDSWKNCILLVEDLDGAYNALLPLRELMTNNSIGRYSTRTNKLTGEIEQIYLHVEGPVCVAGATTHDRIYEDNANRSFLIYVSEKPEYVEKVLEYQRKYESGLIDQSKPEKVINLLKAAQLLLKPVEVKIPFGEDLRIPEYVFKKLRTNKHYLTLIKAIAFWNQKQRKWHKREDGSYYILATIEDVEWANFLCKEALLRKSDELSHALRDFFESLKVFVKNNSNINFYARDVQKHFRLYPMKINRYLRELALIGHIQKVGGNHKTSYEYKIMVWDDYEILQKGVTILDEILEKLKKKYKKS